MLSRNFPSGQGLRNEHVWYGGGKASACSREKNRRKKRMGYCESRSDGSSLSIFRMYASPEVILALNYALVKQNNGIFKGVLKSTTDCGGWRNKKCG